MPYDEQGRQLSDDGYWAWDGRQWQPARPAPAPSPDQPPSAAATSVTQQVSVPSTHGPAPSPGGYPATGLPPGGYPDTSPTGSRPRSRGKVVAIIAAAAVV